MPTAGIAAELRALPFRQRCRPVAVEFFGEPPRDLPAGRVILAHEQVFDRGLDPPQDYRRLLRLVAATDFQGRREQVIEDLVGVPSAPY